jgi:hypothetical protein
MKQYKQYQVYCHLKGDTVQSGGSVGYSSSLMKLAQPTSQFVSDHHVVSNRTIAVLTITDIRTADITEGNG